MATLSQLKAEPVYGLEFAPPSIVALGKAVRAHFGLPADAIGTKGDFRHLRGYHRSRAWVKGSKYSTNRTYSVTETAGNKSGGNDNWVCALDLTLGEHMLPVCQRLDKAVRAGRLEKVTEWYGNTNGDSKVDGWNNVRNAVASSDSSHLWHLHISFDRGRAGEDHADVLAVLTGTAPSTEEDPLMALTDDDQQVLIWSVDALVNDHPKVAGGPYKGKPNATHAALADLAAKVDALAALTVDGAAVAKALLADPGFAKVLADAAFAGAQRAERE